MFYFRISPRSVEVWAGHINRSVSKNNWILASVSDIHVHENYLPDKVYNDVAILKVGNLFSK
jgi:hypothetical protein